MWVARGGARRPHRTPHGLLSCRDLLSLAWVTLIRPGTAPLAPGCSRRSWLTACPTGAVVQGSGVALRQGHRSPPVPAGGQAVSGCFPAVSPCPQEAGGLEAGLGPLDPSPGPHTRLGLCLQALARTREPIVLPAKCFCPRPGLFPPSCSWSPCPRRGGSFTWLWAPGRGLPWPLGGDAWARGGSEDPPARASEGHWSPHHLSIARGALAGPAQMEVPPCGK